MNINLPKDIDKLKREHYSYLTKKQGAMRGVLSDGIDAIYALDYHSLNGKLWSQLEALLMLPISISYVLGGYIYEWAAQHPELHEKIIHLFRTGKLPVRKNSITFCLNIKASKLAISLMELGLQDKNEGIILKTADVILRSRQKQFIPALESLLKNNPSPKLKKELEFATELLKNGYHRDNQYNTIHLLMDNGSILGVSAHELDNLNPEAFEEKLKELRQEL